jgi:hypothetical protein
MTTDQKIIETKVGFLQLAKQSGKWRNPSDPRPVIPVVIR